MIKKEDLCSLQLTSNQPLQNSEIELSSSISLKGRRGKVKEKGMKRVEFQIWLNPFPVDTVIVFPKQIDSYTPGIYAPLSKNDFEFEF